MNVSHRAGKLPKNRDEVRAILDDLVARFKDDWDRPLERWDDRYPDSERRAPQRGDWEALESKFGCTFEDTFVWFMELIADYNLPGTLHVRRDKPSHYLDDRRIDDVWDHEMSFGGWDPAMIPFNDFSNGDFYCLRTAVDGRSPVWFHDHESGSDEKVTDSFAEFLANLEYHINGT